MRYSGTKQARASPLAAQLLHITGSVLLVQILHAEGAACRHSTSPRLQSPTGAGPADGLCGSEVLVHNRGPNLLQFTAPVAVCFPLKTGKIKITHEGFQSNKRWSLFAFHAVSRLREASRADQPCRMTWCYQWVSLQTVVSRPMASLAWQDQWKGIEKLRLQFVLPVYILLRF